MYAPYVLAVKRRVEKRFELSENKLENFYEGFSQLYLSFDTKKETIRIKFDSVYRDLVSDNNTVLYGLHFFRRECEGCFGPIKTFVDWVFGTSSKFPGDPPFYIRVKDGKLYSWIDGKNKYRFYYNNEVIYYTKSQNGEIIEGGVLNDDCFEFIPIYNMEMNDGIKYENYYFGFKSIHSSPSRKIVLDHSGVNRKNYKYIPDYYLKEIDNLIPKIVLPRYYHDYIEFNRILFLSELMTRMRKSYELYDCHVFGIVKEFL